MREDTMRLRRCNVSRSGTDALKVNVALGPPPVKSETTFTRGHTITGGDTMPGRASKPVVLVEDNGWRSMSGTYHAQALGVRAHQLRVEIHGELNDGEII
jgi:hypothetical protein